MGLSLLASMLVAGRPGWPQQSSASASGQPSGLPSPAAQAAHSPAAQAQAAAASQVQAADDQSNDRPSLSEESMGRLRNIDRQKKLVDDTNKLLGLANELKAEVDKSSKDTLSLDVVRKADEIEKLAHSVKERMKGS
jgi:nitric oxide reductase activation protein